MSKNMRHITAGIIAVILILTMVIGVVAPVLAAEVGGAEALFNGSESKIDGELSKSLIVYDNSTDYHTNDLERILNGETYYVAVYPKAENYSYKIVWGSEDAGFKYLVGTEFEDTINNCTNIEFSESSNTVSSLSDAIKKSSALNSASDTHMFNDSAIITLDNIPSNFKSVDELKSYLDTYFIYVVDSSDSVKYKIPICDAYKWTSSYISSNGSTQEGTKPQEIIETPSTAIDEESQVVNTEPSTVDNVVDEYETIQSTEVGEKIEGVVGNDTSLVYTSVDLSLAEETDKKYVIHVSIKVPDGHTVVSGYCKDTRNDIYVYSDIISELEFDFEVDKSQVSSLYFAAEEDNGFESFSDILRLDIIESFDSDVKNTDLVKGSFDVTFTGLPDSANEGDSVVFQMNTEVPSYMKFNGVSIGRNMLGTNFDVTVSANGVYTYEAVSESGEIVTGEYEVNIFTSDSDTNRNITVYVVCGVVLVSLCFLFVIVNKRRSKHGKEEKELTEEDL